MKTILLTICVLIFSTHVIAQAPQAIPYQAVARDASGNPLVNQAISIRFNIRLGFSSGIILYQETHNVITNSLGLFTAKIGAGLPTIGSFPSQTWGDGFSRFLEVEMDPAGGSSYVSMGSEQFLSAPFALYANSAASAPGTIAFTTYVDGPIPALSDASAYQFLGTTASVTISTGQQVEVTATCALGSLFTAGATMDRITIVRKSTVDVNPIDNGSDYIEFMKIPQNLRLPVTLNTIFAGLPAGTYQFGMGYQCTFGQAAGWNYNDWSRVTVKVINP